MKTITYLSTTIALLASSAAAAAAEVATGSQQAERNLQNGAICTAIEAALLTDNFSCECTLNGLTGIELACDRGAVCGPGGIACAGFGIDVGFELTGGGDLTTAICLQDFTVNIGDGFEFDEFCIDYQVNILEDVIGTLCPDGIVACLEDLTGAADVAVASKSVASVTECTVTADGETCNSCTPCDGRGGVMFDCSNVSPGFVTSTCARFRPSLGLGSKIAGRIPKFNLKK